MMLAGEEFVADTHDQILGNLVEPSASVIGDGRRPLQDGVGRNHLPRDQILADAEMLQRSLGLRAPQLVGRNLDCAQAVEFGANFGHPSLLMLGNQVCTTTRPSQPIATPDSARAYRERANANIAGLAARPPGFSIPPRSPGGIDGAGS